jgi:hypothetical protein
MAGKGKFLYIFSPGMSNDVTDEEHRIYIGDSAKHMDEGTQYFPLGNFSTDDLLKLKAQIATALECRMDLDDVTEKNLEALKTKLRSAKTEVIAQLARQTLDRLDVVASDEKRAKTRLAIIEDELRHRMEEDGSAEMKFTGVLGVSYKPETVYNVGEEGWTPVYSSIVAESVEKQFADDGVVRAIANNQDVAEYVVRDIANDIVGSIRDGLRNAEAFAILQKRLTSTTLNDLTKQGLDLPNGVEQKTLQKLKLRKLK